MMPKTLKAKALYVICISYSLNPCTQFIPIFLYIRSGLRDGVAFRHEMQFMDIVKESVAYIDNFEKVKIKNFRLWNVYSL